MSCAIMQAVTTRLDEPSVEELRKLSKERNMKMSALVRSVVHQYLLQLQKESQAH